MDDIFNPSDDTTDIPENAYEVLVGEGKKFRDNEALAKSTFHKDSFINQLQRENAELRQAQQKAMTIEEIKTMILAAKPSQEVQTPPNGQPPVTPPAPTTQETDLEALVATLLEKKESESKAKTNREKVTETLKEKFGADSQMILNQKAKELNLSLEYLSKIANDSPNAFFRLIGVDTQVHTPQTAAPRSTTSVPLTDNSRQAYWENMKKSNPGEYFSQKNMMQRYKEAMGKTN